MEPVLVLSQHFPCQVLDEIWHATCYNPISRSIFCANLCAFFWHATCYNPISRSKFRANLRVPARFARRAAQQDACQLRRLGAISSQKRLSAKR
jgi:hypothetical protein